MSKHLPFTEVTGDEAILNFIFNKSHIKFEPPAPPLPEDEADVEYFKTLNEKELAIVKMAEDGELDKAEEEFTKLLEEYSDAPSVYNNRCQVRRLKGDKDGAMGDVNECITLALRWLAVHEKTKPEGSVKRRRDVLKQAYTQRSLLRKDNGEAEAAESDLRAAAACGSDIARIMTEKDNPFATLCRQTVEVMLSSVASGNYESSDNAAVDDIQ